MHEEYTVSVEYWYPFCGSYLYKINYVAWVLNLLGMDSMYVYNDFGILWILSCICIVHGENIYIFVACWNGEKFRKKLMPNTGYNICYNAQIWCHTSKKASSSSLKWMPNVLKGISFFIKTVASTLFGIVFFVNTVSYERFWHRFLSKMCCLYRL